MAALEDLVDDKRFWPVLKTALTCLTDELDKAKGPARCYTGLIIGDQMPLGLMNCTDGGCGVAWVRPVTAFPSLTFPNPAEFAPCGAPMAMTIEIGVARCYPRPTGKNIYPDPQAMFDATRLYMSDRAAMERAICCVGREMGSDFQVSKNAWLPITPGNGASGGTWTFSVG